MENFKWLDSSTWLKDNSLIDAIENYLQTFKGEIDKIISEVNQTINNMNHFMDFATYYIWISSVAILIMLIILIVIVFKLHGIKKFNMELKQQLDSIYNKDIQDS